MDGFACAPPLVGEIASRRVVGDLHRLGGTALAARVGRLAGALQAAGVGRATGWHRSPGTATTVELALASVAAGIRLVGQADEAGARVLFLDLSFMPLVESIALAGEGDMPGPAAIPNLRCYEAILAR